MGVFSFIGRNLVRPYTQTYKDLKKSTAGIRDSMQELKELKAKQKEKESIEYIEAENDVEAFKILYEKGGWNEETLESQRKGVRRAKWVFLLFSLFGIFLFIAVGMNSSNIIFILAATGACFLLTGVFAMRALQMAIFQTQIEERRLIGFSEFMGRSDFWSRLIK